MPAERLQKILAHAGVASRRKAEELIEAGHVTVNGKVVRELGSKADLAEDVIQVDGRTLRETQDKVYYVLYKPVGCVTTLSDPEKRPTIKTYLEDIPERVYPVGRLDYDVEGALIVTNDG
ncbi:MAG: pseudouridine synthase, partial [Deltaproteobacteria bacterium]